MPAPANLVHQTSTTTGTGAKTLAAVNGKRTFLAAFGTGGTNTFDYFISNRDAAEWERGTGHESGGTLVADTVIESSNANAAVSFSAGTKDIMNDVPAAKQIYDGRYTTLSGYGITDAAAQGKQTIGVSSGGIFPATTNGCAALAQAETATNKINYKYLAFDPSAVEYAWVWFPSPKSYNASTFTMRFKWTHPATTTNFAVVWQVEMLSLADDDAIDTAVGSAVIVTDTGGTTQDFYKTSETGSITPSNTAAKQDEIAVRVSRLATSGSDTLAVDAHLIGIEIYYTTNAGNDA